MKTGRASFWTAVVVGASAMVSGCSASSDDALDELGGGGPAQSETAAPVDEQEVATSEQSLLNGLDFATNLTGLPPIGAHLCSQDEKLGAIQVAILARTVVKTQAFADCVTQVASRSIFVDGFAMGPYQRCSTEPTGSNASTIIAAARNTRPVKLGCTDGDGRVAGLTVFSNGTGTYDAITIWSPKASKLLDTPDFLGRMGKLKGPAGTYVHEVLHTWGFDDAQRCGSNFWQRASYIVDACVEQIIATSLNRCAVQACPNAGELNLLSSYPVVNDATGQLASTVGCACVRDHVGPASTNVPASPRLGTNDLDDGYGTSTVAGDFNDDGFQDLAVGAPFDAGGQGRVYLYRGTVMGLYPWKVLSQGGTANEAGDRFGAALAAGRLDGDGFDDLAVGIPGENDSAGAVQVFRGGMDVVSARRIVEVGFDEPEAGDQFGSSLAIGRFFNQTTAGLAVGAYGERVFDRANGMVFIFQGSNNTSGTMPLTHVAYSYANTATDTGAFGFSLSAGRIDGDLLDDLVIGDPTRNSSAGAIHVIGGRTTQGAWFPDGRLDSPLGAGTAQFYGYTVAVNDLIGVGGIAVGAPLSESSKGRLYLYTSNGVLWGTLLGNMNGGNFALRVAAGRTTDELLVGATNQNGGIVGALRPTFVSGALNVTWGQTLAQNDTSEANDRFGFSLTPGDFDGDGDRDLVVGSPGEGLGSSPAGSGAISLFLNDGGTLFNWGVAHQAL